MEVPAAVVGIGFASVDAVTEPFNKIGTDRAEGADDIWTARLAMAPLDNVALFEPLRTHVVEPVDFEHCTAFPAATEAAPAVTVTEVTSVGE